MIALKDKIRIYTKRNVITLKGDNCWSDLERLKEQYFSIDEDEYIHIYVKYKFHFIWKRLYSIFDL